MAIENPRTRIFCVAEESSWLPDNLAGIPVTGSVPLHSGRLWARSSSPLPRIRCSDALAEINIVLAGVSSLI